MIEALGGHNLSIFDVYRRLLVIVVGTYVLVRTASYIWRWQAYGASGNRTEMFLRRYVVTLLLRTRVHRFWLEFLQIAALIAVLGYLLHMHR